MKLLLDENLSRRLLAPLSQAYPGSSHVVTEGLQQALDIEIWDFARAQDFAVVTKDDDFTALSGLRGRPPCLVKLSVGNCSNEQVLQIPLTQRLTIESRFGEPDVAMVELIRATA